jgi:hypothetical protein
MSGFLTDYMNNKILDMVFGATAFAPAATLYVGMSLGGSSKFGIPNEPVGGGYARVALPNTPASFPAALGGTKSNAVVVTFPTPTANWGTIVSLFLADAPAGGNVIAMADLAVPKTINGGSAAATVAVGSLFLSHT